jgi:hypothetical protein
MAMHGPRHRMMAMLDAFADDVDHRSLGSWHTAGQHGIKSAGTPLIGYPFGVYCGHFAHSHIRNTRYEKADRSAFYR